MAQHGTAIIGMMEVEGELNYELEEQKIQAIRTSNLNTIQRFLTSVETDINATRQKIHSRMLSMCEEKKKLQQKIEDTRQRIQQAEAKRSRDKEEVQQLERELERLKIQLQGKKEELEAQKKVLATCMEEIKKKESLVSETKAENQEKMRQAEHCIELYKKYLGLDIICLQNTLVLKFTQVSQINPEAEYMVRLGLEEDKYTLLGSEPPLPSLPQLQEELNASGNLLACLVQIRKLFQRME
ncbi:kinetochore protein Spc25-like isoform X2 [Portunus trituberculatus]|uniref:kinetochore protein Spc25-like isoform X2 n=1 Tax=Portunus trituberculatus TaxID=210409 RepID=UPI001E1CD53F|nr:kinetochore protein Spc25-like isoform X2 [Portunus trituberculatus]